MMMEITEKQQMEAEIYALQEGADQWKAEYDECRQLLQELVVCKAIKETMGKTDRYLIRKEKAWSRAIKFLEQYQHQ